jgi:hypothetical protein
MSDDSDTEHSGGDPRIDALTRASRTIQVSPLDGARLVRAARARRRRQRTIISSVLGAAVVVAGVAVTTAGSSPDQINSNRIDAADQSDAPRTQPLPAPPEGDKWVGLNNLVVAVPSQWPVLDSACGDGSPAVVLDGTMSAAVDCASYDEDVRVVLGPLDRPTGTEWEGTKCAALSPGSCFGARAFAGQGVLVRVEAEGEGSRRTIERILDSATVLPDGWTTLPFGRWNDRVTTRTATLEEAGFEVDTSRIVEASNRPVRTELESGSPVPEGATIALAPLSRASGEADDGTVPTPSSLCLGRGGWSGRMMDKGSPPAGVSLEEALDPYPGAVVGPRDARSALATVRAARQPLRVIALFRATNGSWSVGQEVTCGR